MKRELHSRAEIQTVAGEDLLRSGEEGRLRAPHAEVWGGGTAVLKGGGEAGEGRLPRDIEDSRPAWAIEFSPGSKQQEM